MGEEIEGSGIPDLDTPDMPGLSKVTTEVRKLIEGSQLEEQFFFGQITTALTLSTPAR